MKRRRVLTEFCLSDRSSVYCPRSPRDWTRTSPPQLYVSVHRRAERNPETNAHQQQKRERVDLCLHRNVCELISVYCSLSLSSSVCIVLARPSSPPHFLSSVSRLPPPLRSAMIKTLVFLIDSAQGPLICWHTHTETLVSWKWNKGNVLSDETALRRKSHVWRSDNSLIGHRETTDVELRCRCCSLMVTKCRIFVLSYKDQYTCDGQTAACSVRRTRFKFGWRTAT